MKIIIEAEPKEIAALVMELAQERFKETYVTYSNGMTAEQIAHELQSSISKTLAKTE